MKNFPALTFSLIIATAINAQTWQFDSLVSDHTGDMQFCKDSWNNVYCFNKNAYSVHQTSTAVTKMNSGGKFLWQLVLPSPMQIRTMATSEDSSLYIGGVSWGNFSLGGQTYTTNGGSDIWLLKYTGSGAFVWCKVIGSKEDDDLGEICISGNGLVMTGTAGDTINFAGQLVPKTKDRDLFVAMTDQAGTMQAIKFSATNDTSTYAPGGIGTECAVDPWGNVFLLAEFYGLNSMDTFQIGMTDPQHHQFYRTFALIKLNQQLQTVYTHEFGSCSQICTDNFFDLLVNGNGEAYFVQTYDYGQSGNDDHRSWINKFSPQGSLTGTFQPRPDLTGQITAMDMDNCGNLYFTGWGRNYANAQVVTSRLFNGQVSPALQQQWIKTDSTSTNWVSGEAIVAFSLNDVMVGGFFSDTFTVVNQLINANNYWQRSGFIAHLKNSASSPCDVPNTTAIPVSVPGLKKMLAYPNPTDGIVNIPSGNISGVEVFSACGVCVRKKSCNEGESTVNLSGLPGGIYLLQIRMADTTRSQKVVLRD